MDITISVKQIAWRPVSSYSIGRKTRTWRRRLRDSDGA
jgi:hypothetical protein